jgi:uncharacterized lipoprotein YmbA
MRCFLPLAPLIMLLQGCVSRPPDHLYVLEAQPPGARDARTDFDRQVTLRVTLPSLVDRAQMVLTTSTGAAILEHERWAAPLTDLVTTTLGQDLERRRSDVVVVLRNADRSQVPLVAIAVDVVQLSVRLGEQASLEARWRVTDARTGNVVLGREAFVSPLRAGTYADVATAVSACVGLLADRLVQELPTG